MIRRIIWALLLVLTFLFFYYWLPASVYSQMPLFFALIAAFLLLFFSTQVIGDFRSWTEVTADKDDLNWRHNFSRLLILPALASVFLFVQYYSIDKPDEPDELNKYGVKTTGTIVTGIGRTNSRGDGSFDVTVQFYTKEGKLQTVTTPVDKDKFGLLHVDQEVNLIYSKIHPSRIKLMVNDYEVEQITGIRDRNLDLKDLTTLLTLKQDSVGFYLNTISYKWNKRNSGWFNERKNEFVKIFAGENSVTYVSNEALQFPQLLRKNNFRYVDSTQDKIFGTYESNKFIAVVNMGVTNGKMMSSVTLTKK
jgi:hypothetical protein